MGRGGVDAVCMAWMWMVVMAAVLWWGVGRCDVRCWLRCVCVDVVGCDVHMYTRACVCRMYDCLLLVDACISVSLCFECVWLHVHIHAFACMCTRSYMTCVYVRLCVCAQVTICWLCV